MPSKTKKNESTATVSLNGGPEVPLEQAQPLLDEIVTNALAPSAAEALDTVVDTTAKIVEAMIEPHLSEPSKTIPVPPRVLPVRVTAKEKEEAGQKMAQAYDGLQRTLGHKKAAAAQYKLEEERWNGEIAQHVRTITSEFVHRSVEVEKLIDYAGGVSRFYRTDSGEEIEVRKLTQDELQTKLEIEVPPAENSQGETDIPNTPIPISPANPLGAQCPLCGAEDMGKCPCDPEDVNLEIAKRAEVKA